MADLPRIEPRDVQALLAALARSDVVLVRDHVGDHTNALGLAPPTAIATCFGRAESFALHCEAARAAGLRVTVVDSERVAFDVDGPEDFARLAGTRPARAATT
jgi:2-phospho-L-lactate guanylyltransferase (CobY/MobA/RfbA family)